MSIILTSLTSVKKLAPLNILAVVNEIPLVQIA
jgi:hypothetical protein